MNYLDDLSVAILGQKDPSVELTASLDYRINIIVKTQPNR